MNLVPKFMFDDNLFDDVMFPNIKGNQFSNMRCDIYEKDDTYHIEIDLPGFKRDNLCLEFNHGYLTVLATKKDTDIRNEKNYLKRERTYGVYKREFYVGDVDYSKINAKYKDGVLIIDVLKNSNEKDKKTIEIK